VSLDILSTNVSGYDKTEHTYHRFFPASGCPECVNIRETQFFSSLQATQKQLSAKKIAEKSDAEKTHSGSLAGTMKQGLIKNDCRWMCSFACLPSVAVRQKNIHCKIVFVTIRTPTRKEEKKSCSEPN
jgi:hypothetical protein